MTPPFNYSTNPQEAKVWMNGRYQKAQKQPNGKWMINENGKWQQVPEHILVFNPESYWNGVYSSLEQRRKSSNEYIAHCENEKQKYNKKASTASKLKQGFTQVYKSACNGIKAAKSKLAAILPSGNSNTKNLSVTDQHKAKIIQNEIRSQNDKKNVASGNISAQKSIIRTSDAMFGFYCQQQLDEYCGPLNDVNNLESVARHMKG